MCRYNTFIYIIFLDCYIDDDFKYDVYFLCTMYIYETDVSQAVSTYIDDFCKHIDGS